MRGIIYNNLTRDINLSIPERRDDALSGSEFFRLLPNIPGDKRDELIVEQVLQGNVPRFYRDFKEISIAGKNCNLTMFVAPDYLSVGSDDDFIRVVISAKAAKKIGDAINCALPTSLISDYIFHMSDLKLSPQTLPPDKTMVLTKAVIDHNQLIERQINKKDYTLLDGIKKDIVLHSSLLRNKNKIAIYGWRYPNGKCIQCPVNAGSHDVSYQDYSQGTRFVAHKMLLDTNEIDIFDLLNDGANHYLINAEAKPYDASSIYG